MMYQLEVCDSLLFEVYGDHRDLHGLTHSFPTRLSSDCLAGARYLSKAAVSGKGSIAFFKKLQNHEFRLAIPQTDSYARTHPLTGERIAVLQEVYRSEEHTSALQSLMRISYAVFCLKKKHSKPTNTRTMLLTQ